MRRSFNQPLYSDANSFAGLGKFKNSKLPVSENVPANDTTNGEVKTSVASTGGDNAADVPSRAPAPRRTKPFSKPLTTTITLKPTADNGEDAFSAYAAFLKGDPDVGNDSSKKVPSSTSSKKDARSSSIGTRRSAAIGTKTPSTDRLPSSMGGRNRFNAPLLPTSFSNTPIEESKNQENQDAANEFLAKQSNSYLKKQRKPQPFLSTNLNFSQPPVEESSANYGEPITKSFQPLSRKVNRRKDDATLEFEDTSTTSGGFSTDNHLVEENHYDSTAEERRRNYIRNSDEYGNEVVIEKTRNLTFDFVGSAKSKRTPHTVIEQQEKPETKESRASRSKQLQSMLALDPVSVELFHMDQFDYEKYMSAVRAHNCSQAIVQTFDDGMEESTQTDRVEMKTKWTQRPTGWFKSNASTSTNITSTSIKAEALGVGDDTLVTDSNEVSKNEGYDELKSGEVAIHKDRQKLNKFLRRSCRLMLEVLASQKLMRMATGKIGPDSKNLVKLQKPYSFLQNLSSYTLCSDGDLIACCNGQTATESKKSGDPTTIITVWSMKEPNVPLYFLRTFSQVSALEINSRLGLVIAGCKDASVNCYNLREHAQYHPEEEGQPIRAPSATTSCWPDRNHQSQIVGVALIPETKTCAQMISLDREQLLVCWSLFLNTKSEELTTAESVWSKLKLKLRSVINVPDIFARWPMKLLSLRVWRQENSTDVNVMIATNCGFMGKGLLYGGSIIACMEPDSDSSGYESSQGSMDKYMGGIVESAVVVVTSFDIQLVNELIIASYEDGLCRLFLFGKTQPILLLNCYDPPFKARWSKVRHSMFYVGYNNRLEVWDILQSDIVPDTQIAFKVPTYELRDFELFNTNAGEFIAILTPEGISIGSPPKKVEKLTEKDESRLRTYFEVIT